MNIFCVTSQNKTGWTAVYSDTLSYANCNTEVVNSLLSIPTYTWAVENKDKLSNERQYVPPVRMPKGYNMMEHFDAHE